MLRPRPSLALAALLALVSCGDERPPRRQIGGSPAGDVCQLVELVACSVPGCREPDCTAPRYWCCSYGEIGQPLGCFYSTDLTRCWYSHQALTP
jgi:hypothetical protein